MSDGPTIGDHRFDGLGVEEAIKLIREVSDGPGSGAVTDSHQGLANSASILLVLDSKIRTELGKLGVDWQGSAAEFAHGLIGVAAEYGGAAYSPLRSSALSVEIQGGSHDDTRNHMPSEEEVRVTASENLMEKAGGVFGYESDMDKEEKASREARELVAYRMSVYRDISREALDTHRPLEPPPDISLTADPPPATPPQSTVDDRFTDGRSTVDTHRNGAPPGGSSDITSAPSPAPAPVLPPPAAPTPGASAPGQPPVSTPWPPPGTGGQVTQEPGGPRAGFTPPLLPGGPGSGDTAGRGSGARGGLSGSPDGGRQHAQGEHGGGRPGAGRSGVAAPAAETTAARGPAAARATGSSGFVPPAAAGGRREGDAEHNRRYGVQSAEPFEDDVQVAPPVIGEKRQT